MRAARYGACLVTANHNPLSDLTLPAGAADPRFREIFAYWRNKAPPGLLPGRQHINPLDIPRLLPLVALYDVVRDDSNLRFRTRLSGTGVVAAFGSDFTGRFLDEITPPAVYGEFHTAYSSVAETGRPHYWERPVPFAVRDFMAIQRLALPLAADGISVDIIIAYYVPIAHPALKNRASSAAD